MLVSELIEKSVYLPKRLAPNKNPLVSIILPTFNPPEDVFKVCIESLLDQTFKDFELIIIDDASREEFFKELLVLRERDSRISLIRHQKRIGLPAISVYEGFTKSTSDFFFFAFQDNEYFLEALSLLYGSAIKLKAKFIHGLFYLQSNPDQKIVIGELPKIYLNFTNIIANSSVLINREVLEKVGLYDPHICLSRLCDWDLWRRVAEKFQIHKIDHFIGIEKGVTIKGSLGRTFPLMREAAFNRMNLYDRENKLLPKNYSNCNVKENDLTFSQKAEAEILCLDSFFKRNIWDEVKKSSPLKGLILTTGKETCSLTPFLSNSHYLFQVRLLSDYTLDQYLVDLANFDFFIINRRLDNPFFHGLIKICRELGKSIFWYLDDNFFEIGKQNLDYSWFKNLVRVKEITSGLDGIVAPSKTLIDYLKTIKINENVFFIPPIQYSWKTQEVIFEGRKPPKKLVVAFCGGPHRKKEFFNFVIPSLEKIRKFVPVKLVLFNCFFNSDLFEIINFDLELSYRQMLLKMIDEGVNVITHPGDPSHINNLYKVPTAILIGDSINAVPFVSEGEPYLKYGQEGACLLIEGNVDAWYNAFYNFTFNENFVEPIREKLRNVCMVEFSEKESLKAFKLIKIVKNNQTHVYDIQYVLSKLFGSINEFNLFLENEYKSQGIKIKIKVKILKFLNNFPRLKKIIKKYYLILREFKYRLGFIYLRNKFFGIFNP